MTFTPESLPDLGGKVYLVTGGNTGIGFHTVLQLAAHRGKVYLGARSQLKGDAAIQEIKAQVPNAEVYLLKMDMADLRSVVSAAKELLKKEKYLHGLVNNAGVMATPFELTTDGYESQFQINYISHWLLTYHLMPIILDAAAKSAPGTVRIVNVASNGHTNAAPRGIDLQDINQVHGGPVSRYGSSKLANILHTKELARRYSTPLARATNTSLTAEKSGGGEIWAASLHPGMVNTNLLSQANGSILVSMMGAVLKGLSKVSLVGSSPAIGAYTQLFAVGSKDFTRDMNGAYLIPVARVAKPSKFGEDAGLAKDLWDWTEKQMEEAGLI